MDKNPSESILKNLVHEEHTGIDVANYFDLAT